MFETAVLSYGPPGKRAWATAMGFTGQALLIGCALLVPLISPQSLGRAVWVTTLMPPGPPPPPPRPPGTQVVPRGARPVRTQISAGSVVLPSYVPPVAATIIDEPPDAPEGPPGVTGGIYSGKEGGIANSILSTVHPPAPPPVIESAPEPARPVVKPPEMVRPPRITVVRMATPIRRVEPIYPDLARRARVSGVVELIGVLGVDGRIHELKVLRGHPLLIKAAMDAVLQWIYEPTLLNGQAVEVSAPITVNFILN
ncbi:MAG: TonB family protein [Candidatus Solibacter sp.]